MLQGTYMNYVCIFSGFFTPSLSNLHMVYTNWLRLQPKPPFDWLLSARALMPLLQGGKSNWYWKIQIKLGGCSGFFIWNLQNWRMRKGWQRYELINKVDLFSKIGIQNTKCMKRDYCLITQTTIEKFENWIHIALAETINIRTICTLVQLTISNISSILFPYF